jgi:serine/threonine protein kinase
MRGQLPETEVLGLMVDVLEGCQELYRKGVIHRDIKSSNILLTKGRAKLADFGFAVRLDKLQEKEKYNVGSPMYMSP